MDKPKVMPYDITKCDKHLLSIGLEPEGTKINVKCDGHYVLYSNNLLLANGHFYENLIKCFLTWPRLFHGGSAHPKRNIPALYYFPVTLQMVLSKVACHLQFHLMYILTSCYTGCKMILLNVWELFSSVLCVLLMIWYFNVGQSGDSRKS